MINDGVTPLLMASHEGHVTVVQQLLASDAAVDHVDSMSRTPLCPRC